MDVKERRPYCSLTKGRREKERRYTGSSGDTDDCRVPTQKSYSSSETLKAFDQDPSARLLYGGRVKEMVHREADEYTRQGEWAHTLTLTHTHIPIHTHNTHTHIPIHTYNTPTSKRIYFPHRTFTTCTGE